MTAYGNLLTAAYTADDLRAWKQNGAGVRTYFIYNGDRPVCELDSTGAVVAVNTFGGNGLLSRHIASGSIFYTFDPEENVAQRLDLGQNVLSTSVYDDFGEKLTSDGATDPFGYGGQAGYYTDTETMLPVLTHRYYDPAEGSFLNWDPIGYRGGINEYAYTSNDPADHVDPSGWYTQDGPPPWWTNGDGKLGKEAQACLGEVLNINSCPHNLDFGKVMDVADCIMWCETANKPSMYDPMVPDRPKCQRRLKIPHFAG